MCPASSDHAMPHCCPSLMGWCDHRSGCACGWRRTTRWKSRGGSRKRRATVAEHDGVRLQIRQVQIAVSEDTAHLWDAMTVRFGFATFDQTIQALALLGAAALVQVDLGVIPDHHLPEDPAKLRSIVWPWLRRLRQDGGASGR